MKRWQKWTLGSISVIIVAVLIFVALNWTTISVMMGTEDLTGKKEAIPEVVVELKPVMAGENDWTSWLGPDKDNRSKITGLVMDWSAGLNQQWEVNFLCQENSSAAWSAPVIKGNRLIASGRDLENDLVFCLDSEDGSLIWKTAYPAESKSSHGSGPRATPFIDEDRVYTFGRAGDLVCWNLLDGKQIWRKNVGEQGGKEPTWGHSSSPLILRELVVVQGGGTVRTIAFDKNSGETAWKSGTGLAGYAALLSREIENKTAILAFHGTGLAALNAANGEELWNFPWETPYDANATTPLLIDNNVFITSGYGTGCLMLEVNSSGVDSLWQTKAISSHHSDPYAIDGYLYGYSGDSYQNKGSFVCVDINTGEQKWTTKKMGWGTCCFADGHLVCLDIKGNLFLMKPEPEKFVLVTEFPDALGDIRGPVWTKPVIANGFLYLRFKQKLICYDIVD